VEPWSEGKPKFLGVHEPVPKCTSFAYKPSLKGANYIYTFWSIWCSLSSHKLAEKGCQFLTFNENFQIEEVHSFETFLCTLHDLCVFTLPNICSMTGSNYWLEYQATPQLSSYSLPVFNEKSLVICYAQLNPLAMNRRTFNEHVCRLISLVWLNQSSWNFQGLFNYKWRTYIPKIRSLSQKLIVLQHLQ
jgi:hypothetical protein